uniref:Putative secreted protein n=1 Tax=Anopheles triannulatus TaxID=58253 RepID=A0A2M4B677_9DIPT
MALALLLGQAIGSRTTGLIAYDCANSDVNITGYSLMNVASCTPPARQVEAVATIFKIQVNQPGRGERSRP